MSGEDGDADAGNGALSGGGGGESGETEGRDPPADADGAQPAVADALGIEALLSAYALKDERRTGWQLRGVTDPETVAGHTWGVGLLSLLLAPGVPGVDADRALRMAVVHDVAEATVGDIPTRAEPAAETVEAGEKARRERAALAALADGFGPAGPAVLDLWEEYEAGETAAARLCRDADALDACLQALAYEREDRYDPAAGDPSAFGAYEALDEFFATAERKVTTPAGRALFERVRERYERERERESGE